MQNFRQLIWDHGPVLTTTLLVSVLAVGGTQANAQPPRSSTRKPSPAEIKRLDSQLKDAYGVFLNQTVDLIKSYENLGQFDRAKLIVEALSKLDPENEAMKAKITELENQMLEAGVFEVSLVPGDGWQAIGAVSQGDVVRVQIVGEYRFQTTGATTAAGITGDSPETDFMRGIPLGAVMGMIAQPVSAAGDKKDEKPRPFVVGANYDKRADKDGVLYLKANLPVGTECTGRLEAKITGPRR
jgi:type II secretory pathway component HofQ